MAEISRSDSVWISALRAQEPFSVEEMVERVPAAERTVRKRLTVMCENGFLSRIGGRGQERVRYVRKKDIERMETVWEG